MDGEIAHAEQCSNSHALNEVVDLIIDIESFEQKCGILKGFLQSDRIK